jgi:hypothetical protein
MIKTNVKTNIFILVFFLFIGFSVMEGYICKFYSHPLHLAEIDDKNYLPNYCIDIFKNYWSENGIIEYLQVVLLILAIYFLFSSRIFFYDNNKSIYYLIIIKIIGLTYFLGEEISWGQHIFKWASPDFFIDLNNQKETNLHNISNLFDQLPRTIVLLWCCFSIIIIKYVNKFVKINKMLFIFINPNLKVFLISLLLFFFVLPDLIVDYLGLHPGHGNNSYKDVILGLEKGLFSNSMPKSIFYDVITFNFLRLSELHELIFAFYFFIHSYLLKKKIQTIL